MSMTQKQGAQQLVQRARAGDQNAMGMISMVGRNARAGNPTAQTAFGLIQNFIKNNPAKVRAQLGCSVMGAEATQAVSALTAVAPDPSQIEQIFSILCALPIIGDTTAIKTACVVLSCGAPWNKSRVSAIDQNLAGAEQELFRYGYDVSGNQGRLQPVAQSLNPRGAGLLCAGHVIGSARKIQLARLPQVPIGIIDPNVGWELGC